VILCTIVYGPLLGDISCFRHFVSVRQPASADYVILIQYYKGLLNHVSTNWEVDGNNYTDNLAFSI